MVRKTKEIKAKVTDTKPKGRPTRKPPVPATEPTPAVRPTPQGQGSPPETEITHPGEGAEAEKPRKPLEIKEVTAEKENMSGAHSIFALEAMKERGIPPMLLSVAETVGLTQEEILACKDKESLVAAIEVAEGSTKAKGRISPVIEPKIGVEKAKVAGEVPAELIERAIKIGFTDEQINSYIDPEALEMACSRIKPQATPQPPPKKRQIFRPFKEKPKGKPAKATCISEISTLRAAHVIRAGYDQSNMEVFCRQHKPKILPESIQKVIVVRDYVPNKRGILTSTITIDYLKEA